MIDEHRFREVHVSIAIGRILLDLTLFPVVQLTETGPSAHVRDFMAAFDRVLALNRRFVSLHDARAITGWDVSDRAAVHAWLKVNASELQRLVRGHGAIVTGVAQRSHAASVFWGTGLEGGVSYFEDPTAAHVWACKAARVGSGVSSG